MLNFYRFFLDCGTPCTSKPLINNATKLHNLPNNKANRNRSVTYHLTSFTQACKYYHCTCKSSCKGKWLHRMMSCPSKAQPLANLKSNPSELLYTCCLTKFWEGGQSGQYPSVIKHIIVSEIFFLVNFVGDGVLWSWFSN